jgi:uncharacterized protein YqeY
MAIFDDINSGIKEAMKAKDKVRLEALRAIKKVMLEVKSASGSGGELSDDDSLKIISKLAKQGTDSANIYKEQGREDLAQVEMEQIAVFKTFLPEMLSDQELDVAIKEIVEKSGAESIKDMGKVMGIASKQLAGKADGKAISEKVRSLLQ